MLRAIGETVDRITTPFRPEPGTTEGAVMLGLVMMAGGLLLAGLAPLALFLPGAILVAIGSVPVIRRGGR
jgi:hypothetical protein